MKKDMSSNAKLSFLERFGYGVGDYAANLVYSAISAFLLVYYTNVIGASAAAAASIIAISKIFDGVSDLTKRSSADSDHDLLRLDPCRYIRPLRRVYAVLRP
ncbi:MAG: MFS transporter [Lachnospiraceae bacterium]